MLTDPEEHAVLERLRLVESSVAVQEEVVKSVHEELIKAATLADSMAQLSEGAATLAAALVTVHENAERLCSVEQAVDTKAESADVNAVEAAARRGRRQIAGFGLGAVALLVVGYLALATAGYRGCLERQDGFRTVAQVLESFRDPANPSPRLDAGSVQLRSIFADSCSERYPVRFPWA